MRTAAGALLGLLACASGLPAQDTTQVYPWRLSYFPYVTASPNEGAMGHARAVLFRQSRWDDRASIHDQLAIDGGYSTKDAWMVRLQADLPRIAPGWRLQALAQLQRVRNYTIGQPFAAAAPFEVAAVHRAEAGLEISRAIAGPVSLALRGDAVRLSSLTIPDHSVGESDVRGRLAVVVDLRDREYDTRRGALLQAGVFGGSAATGYHGWYGLASGWVPVGRRTLLTGRVGFRRLDDAGGLPIDASRIIPGWENEFVVAGGPQSNRGLAVGQMVSDRVALASAEVRRPVFEFPGGAVSVLMFVDGSQVRQREQIVYLSARTTALPGGTGPLADWVVGVGGGAALRLLRNAILTATLGRAEHATRFYVSSGWSW